jgi:PTH2 family peptidyl-tRNA hydrolase
MSDYKQVIIIRKDLDMGTGKIAAQAAHAARGAAEYADEDVKTPWVLSGETKIVLAADSKEDLLEIKKQLSLTDIPKKLVADQGHTELDPGTVTAMAVGPAEASKIDNYTGDLSLFR